jgi:hypothetical protein
MVAGATFVVAVWGDKPVLRIFLSTGNILLSLILGALMMALVAIYSPETLSLMLGWARSFKGLITGTGLSAKYNIWLELLLEERQLLFMGFTIFARILLGLLTIPLTRVRRRGSAQPQRPSYG